MRIETIERKLFTFDELDESAKEKARDWYRVGMEFAEDHTGYIAEDAKEAAERMGLTISTRAGSTNHLAVYYSGFCSQGDGACCEGTWRAGDVKFGQVKVHAPKDVELHAIAAEFERIAAAFPSACFTVEHRGRYYHSGCTYFDISLGDDDAEDEVRDSQAEKTLEAKRDEAEQALKDNARRFMDWIYSQLEKEYEYQTSDETVDENIVANEYEFLETGERA